ncbi:hypothetical protein [Modestobacter marinus]|uniref:hypothetical protein n=1 Tax=Modestobacter marinus TaxID=477641 RepID=UPI001C941487|nr:hypothetical protein [Modestobacter marinus]
MISDGVSREGDEPPDPRTDRAPPVQSLARRREVLYQLRRIALHLETAAVLDRRAASSDNAALAEVLRERAEQRRRTAERLRAGLLDADRAGRAAW